MKGIVSYFNTQKGIGSILGEDGKSYFFHYSEIRAAYKVPSRNARVEFEVQKISDPTKNDAAINIAIEGAKTVLDKNPFLLGPINNPEFFAGRKQILAEGINALVNNNNILLTGARGMGKSSLANQFVYIAQGNNYLPNKLEIEFGNATSLEYGVVSFRAFKNSTINDIAGNIVREFIKRFNLDKIEQIRRDIDLNLYQMKMVTLKSSYGTSNLVDHFNFDIIKIHDYLKFKNGLLIFVDEVENIEPDTGFANFIKNVTEYFSTESKNIVFILCGISSAITDLFFQHPSFYRLFTPLEVKEFSHMESYQLIDLCLKKSKLINSGAKTFISRSSRGFPVNLQLMGFYSYHIDTDGCITEEDVRSACDHIVDRVKKNEFENKHESIGYGLTEDILRYTVVEKNGEIWFPEIQSHFQKASEHDIYTAIETLVNMEIFHSEKKGVYFVRDHLFYIYLKKCYRA